MRQKRVELVHEVFGDEIGPSNHVKWVGEDWTVDFATDGVQVLQDLLVDLHEDDLLVDGRHADLDWLFLALWWASADTQHHLLLDLVVRRWVREILWQTVGVYNEQVHEHASYV